MQKLNNFNSVLSHIDPDDSTTWEGKNFLTLDVDWAHDEVISYAIDLIEQADASATWFITHETPMLDRLRENSKFELGIHPNFNELLAGNSNFSSSASEIVKRMKTIVPDCVSVRSHSLVQSERLVDVFCQAELSHISNFYIPESAEGLLQPWKLWDGMIAIPHCWQDNVSMRSNGSVRAPNSSLQKSIKVFDFHPIHIFLNNEHMDRYEKSRSYFQHPSQLRQFRNTERNGTKDVLSELLEIG